MLRNSIHRWLKRVTCYAGRWWFAPLLAFLSALDAYAVIVPNDPLIAAGCFAKPRKWLSLTIWMTIGNTLGALSVAALVSSNSGWIFDHLVSNHLRHSHEWKTSLRMIRHHGLWGLTLISFSPLPQHAAVIIAGLVDMPLSEIFLAVLVGHGLKYGIIGYLAAKSPHVLRKWKILPRDEGCGEEKRAA